MCSTAAGRLRKRVLALCASVVVVASLSLVDGGILVSSARNADKATAGETVPGDIGGFYKDPNHYKKGTFAGTRMISARAGDQQSDVITLIGSDDGTAFWTLLGRFTSPSRSDLVIDFSPKGGPAGLAGKFAGNNITFADGNVWVRASKPDDAKDAQTSNSDDIGGFYTDPNHFKEGSFAGTRMVSDVQGEARSNDIALVGSDDGDTFWTLHGRFTSEARRELFIDFSPKGGPKLGGTYEDGRIEYDDGNAWSRLNQPPSLSE